VTGGGSIGEGIQVWDMRRVDKPIRTFSWEGIPETDGLGTLVAPKKDNFFV